MKKFCFIIMLISLFFLVAGCGYNSQDKAQTQQTLKGYEVTDAIGRNVFLNAPPERIISLTYGTDEIAAEIVGLDRIVAFSKWAADPEISFITNEQAAKVGRKIDVNLETVLSLHPDLVLVSVATPAEFIKTLEDMKVPVYVAESPQNYEQMRKKVLGVAAVLGEKEKGAALVKKMDDKMHKLQSKLSVLRPEDEKTVLAFTFTGLMGKKGGLFDNMLGLAHIKNGLAEINLNGENQIINKEQVIAVNPDIIFVPTWNYNNENDINGYAQSILNDPAYQNIKAVKNKRLEFVSDRYRYVASQHITEAVEVMAKAVYPEIFK